MRPFRTILLASGLLAPLALASPADAQRRGRDREVTRIDTTFAFSARGTAELNVGDGDIDISSWDRNQVRVRVVSEEGRYDLRPGTDRFSLDANDGWDSDARIEITVPAGTRLNVQTRRGDVGIRRINADVTVRGQGGDVIVSDVTGRLEVGSMNGDLTATAITGDVQVNSISGDVDLNRVTGQVDVETVSGDIAARDIDSRWVRLHSTSGDLDYAGNVTASGRYELSTHSGDVQLAMPGDPGAHVTVSTFNGEITSDFPITLAPGSHDIGTGRSKRFSFDVGRGDARVSLESFSGDITLRGRGTVRGDR